MQRTVTITHIRYHKSRARKGDAKYLDVSNVPDIGDLLSFAYGVWRGMRPHSLWDRPRQFYCDPLPEGSYIAAGRSLLLAAEIGTYGDPSSIKDTETGAEELANADGRLTNAVPQRMVLLVPRGATSAFLYHEHLTGGRLGSQFLDLLKLAWRQNVSGYVLDTETLTRSETWLESANLSQIQARVYGHSGDKFDADLPKDLGRIRVILEPAKGLSYFPSKLLAALTKHTGGRAKLFGLEEEPDEVLVTLGDGDQAKTFVLGSERTPPVRTLVTGHGERRLSDSAFLAWCQDDCLGYFKDLGVEWQTGWNRGSWTDDDLSREVTVLDDQQDGGLAGRP